LSGFIHFKYKLIQKFKIKEFIIWMYVQKQITLFFNIK
jgi:hypothetical protein